MNLTDSIAIHARLRALFADVPRQRVYYREHLRVDPLLRVPGDVLFVDRDRIFNALVSKAAETHQSILLLVQAGQTSDAKSLLRVLNENNVVIEWILQDSGFRLDCYATALQLQTNRFAEVLLEHYPNADVDLQDVAKQVQANTEQLRKQIGGNHTSWARKYDPVKRRLIPLKIAEMFRDLVPAASAVTPTTPSAPASGASAAPPAAVSATSSSASAAPAPAPTQPDSFLYDVAYFDGSAYVHSTITSLQHFVKPHDQYFQITDSRHEADELEKTLFLANLIVTVVLDNFAKFTGLEFSPELDKIFEELKNSTKP
jgi:hypothetical protein